MKIFSILIAAFLFTTNVKAQSCNPLPVPYYEGFQGVTSTSQWPPCWLGVSMGTLFTFTSSGGSFAGCSAFNDNFFHSPEFILNAGYTYSASMVFWQNVNGKLWNKVALHLMKTSSLDLGVFASGTDFTTADSIVGGTFSVATTGTYHLGVEALKVGGLQPPNAFSFFDDLRVGCANNMIINSPISICVGESVELFGSGATSFTFQSSTAISQDNPFYDNALADETYTVSGLIYGSCVDTRTISVKVNECLGVKENKLNASLHNTTVNDHFTLETASGSGMLKLFDLLGKEVYAQSITNILTDVNLSNLPPGVYLLRFVDGNNQFSTKLLHN